MDDNPATVNEINTLTGITGLDIFSQESVSAFDKWSRRFRDYMAVMGRNMGEQEKLDRLRLALDDTPRDLFDKLSAAETATVEVALKALKDKLDSPQRKELAKRSLVLCKQREDESVNIFLKRLSSLIEVAYSNLGLEQFKERLCKEFLDRLKPDLSFLIRLVGLSKEKDLDWVRTQAEELELLLKTH